MKLLVSKTDNIKVKIYCYEQEGEIEATHIKSEVPKNVEAEIVEFTFRKPGYADSNIIIRNASLKMGEGEENLDVLSFQDGILRTLLIDWDMKDEEGQKVVLNTISVNALVPNVARSAVNGVLESIRI